MDHVCAVLRFSLGSKWAKWLLNVLSPFFCTYPIGKTEAPHQSLMRASCAEGGLSFQLEAKLARGDYRSVDPSMDRRRREALPGPFLAGMGFVSSWKLNPPSADLGACETIIVQARPGHRAGDYRSSARSA
jgi:hypothetical protein